MRDIILGHGMYKEQTKSRLNAETTMRVAILKIEPRIEQLAKSVKTNEEIWKIKCM